jgi:hypothetical protein
MDSGFRRNEEQKQSFPSASAQPKDSTLAWPHRAKRNQAAAGASGCASGAARWNASKMRERSEGEWIGCSPSAMANPSPPNPPLEGDGFQVSGPKDALRQQPSNAWGAPINPELRHPAQAGVHFDLDFIGRTSRSIPAFAGMTSKSRAPSASAQPKNSPLSWPRRAKRNQAAAGASGCASGAARWKASKMPERSEGEWITCSPSAMTNPSHPNTPLEGDGFLVSGPKDALRQQPSNAWGALVNPELRHPGASRGPF